MNANSLLRLDSITNLYMEIYDYPFGLSHSISCSHPQLFKIMKKKSYYTDKRKSTFSPEKILWIQHDCMDYLQFRETLEVFVIESFSGNNIFSLHFNNFSKLRLIFCGAHSINNFSHQFKKVIFDDNEEYVFEISHCPALEMVVLENSSCLNFSKFALSHCEKLHTFEFKTNVMESARSLEMSCRQLFRKKITTRLSFTHNIQF